MLEIDGTSHIHEHTHSRTYTQAPAAQDGGVFVRPVILDRWGEGWRDGEREGTSDEEQKLLPSFRCGNYPFSFGWEHYPLWLSYSAW